MKITRMVVIEGYIRISGKAMARQNGQNGQINALEPAEAMVLQERVVNWGFNTQTYVTKVEPTRVLFIAGECT